MLMSFSQLCCFLTPDIEHASHMIGVIPLIPISSFDYFWTTSDEIKPSDRLTNWGKYTEQNDKDEIV